MNRKLNNKRQYRHNGDIAFNITQHYPSRYFMRYCPGEMPHCLLNADEKFENERKPERKQASVAEMPFASSILAYPTRRRVRASVKVSPVTFLKSSEKYVG